MNLFPRLFVFPWLFLVLIVFVLFMVAPILIGIIVYNDARKRKVLSPFVWAMIAALVPFYIGLLLYAIIGVNSVDQNRSA